MYVKLEWPQSLFAFLEACFTSFAALTLPGGQIV